MATVKIHKADGAESGSLELSDAVFGIEPNTNCVRSALDHFMATQRSGTHSTKTRGFVSGGGKKPWAQKGTGRARQGSIRSPQWRGGAIIFGPHPRDYSFHINKKVKRKALCSVFSELMKDGRILAIEDFGTSAPKTSVVTALFDKLKLEGRILLYVDAQDNNLILSSRNIPYVNTVNAENLNIYDLLTHDYVVAKPETLKRLEGAFAS